MDGSAAPTEVGDDDAPAAPTTASPVVQTPPRRKDNKIPKDALTVEESDCLHELAGLAPPKGGDVYTGEIRMFPSPGDDLKATLSKVMRSSDNLEEGEDDEDEYEDCESNF